MNYYAVKCPKCMTSVLRTDKTILDGIVKCPSCDNNYRINIMNTRMLGQEEDPKIPDAVMKTLFEIPSSAKIGIESMPNIFSGAATVCPDGTYTVDEVLAREKWDIRMRVTGYPKIMSAIKFYAFPVSAEYNEYKAWNHAVYSEYVEYQFRSDPGTITFNDIFFITVVIADNVRAKITRPDLFEQEWERWRKEHEDFVDRTLREQSIKPTCNAFNAHIVNVLQKDDGEQDFAEV